MVATLNSSFVLLQSHTRTHAMVFFAASPSTSSTPMYKDAFNWEPLAVHAGAVAPSVSILSPRRVPRAPQRHHVSRPMRHRRASTEGKGIAGGSVNGGCPRVVLFRLERCAQKWLNYVGESHRHMLNERHCPIMPIGIVMVLS